MADLVTLTNAEANTKLRNEGFRVNTATTIFDYLVVSYFKTQNEIIAIGGIQKFTNGQNLKSLMYQTDDISYIKELIKEIRDFTTYYKEQKEEKEAETIYFFIAGKISFEVGIQKDKDNLHYVMAIQMQ